MKFFIAISLTLLLSTSLYSNVNGCLSDLFYANGVKMEETQPEAINHWQETVADLLTHDVLLKIAKINVAYNKSEWYDDDLYEAFEQIMSNEWGWKEFSVFFNVYLQMHGFQESVYQHETDLTTQVKNYRQSIKDGHGVIVIAHSQGNYFTNEAYEQLDEWMKPYFRTMGVATPANHVAGYAPGDTSAPYVKFHNDIVNVVLTGLPSNLEDTRHHGFPSVDAHDFYKSYLVQDDSKSMIVGFIERNLVDHADAPSQWQTDNEFGEDTMNYRITVKHRFDPGITMSEEVYPFAPSKKLYQADLEGDKVWVKASCGGEKVRLQWEDQKDSEFYMIDNPEKEKISGAESFDCKYVDGYATYDARSGGYFIVEIACNSSLYKGNPTQVWSPVSGVYDVPGGSPSFSYFNLMNNSFKHCLYSYEAIENIGGQCQCHECRIYWDQ